MPVLLAHGSSESRGRARLVYGKCLSASASAAHTKSPHDGGSSGRDTAMKQASKSNIITSPILQNGAKSVI